VFFLPLQEKISMELYEISSAFPTAPVVPAVEKYRKTGSTYT
jgi:hypothetical protein